MSSILDLLTDESKWTKGAFARDKDGHPIDSRYNEAVCFCLMGAITHIYTRDKHIEQCQVITKIYNVLSESSIVEFNDNPKTTFQDIVDLCKKAGV